MDCSIKFIKDELECIISTLSKADKPLNDLTDLVNDLNFDSFSLIKLAVEIEINFDIELTDEFLVEDNIRNYKKVYTQIYEMMSERG